MSVQLEAYHGQWSIFMGMNSTDVSINYMRIRLNIEYFIVIIKKTEKAWKILKYYIAYLLNTHIDINTRRNESIEN
jgi:hypothetical protein